MFGPHSGSTCSRLSRACRRPHLCLFGSRGGMQRRALSWCIRAISAAFIAATSRRLNINRGNIDMSTNESAAFDAVIVGSGAGGCAAAYRLGTAGLRVAIVEKGRELPRDASTLDFEKVV